MDSLVRSELERFISEKLPMQTLDVVDDIVLVYITSVLEQLGEDESFDVDEFIEMMNAYVPGFEEIPSDKVYSWMVNLAASLTKTRSIKHDKRIPTVSSSSYNNKAGRTIESRGEVSCSSESTSTALERKGSQQCVPKKNEYKNDTCCIGTEFKGKVSSLCEIFPEACSIEVQRCLLVANGDVEEAARLMIMSRESGDSDDILPNRGMGVTNTLIDSKPKPHLPGAKHQDIDERDQENIKNSLVSRYGFVDVDSDQRTHRPNLQIKDTKKMTRYRDNQVVSTKGERFSLVKNPETEDEKQTYVNLKPARKYRFH